MSCRARGWAETRRLPIEQEINIILHLYYRHLADALGSSMETHFFLSVLHTRKPSYTLYFTKKERKAREEKRGEESKN